jgi:hypothetical protein
VQADVSRRFAGHRVPDPAWRYLERPAVARDRLVALLGEYWHRAIEPDWSRIRSLLEREVAERARQQAQSGTGSLLGDLHPAITWRTGALRVRGRKAARVALAGRGLIVIPSVFAWPLTCSMVAEGYPPAISPTRPAASGRCGRRRTARAWRWRRCSGAPGRPCCGS